MPKLKPLSLLILGIFLSEPLSAYAEVFYDKGGMPNCLSDSSGRSVMLLWKKADLYSREIFVLDSATYASDGRFVAYGCGNVPELSYIPEEHLKTLSPSATRLFGHDLKTARMRKALQQIRNGGSVYRDEMDAKAFLQKFPIPNFTLDINRRLTAMYGVGFVSEIYAETIESDANNRLFKDSIQRNFRLRPDAFNSVKKNREVIYVKGLGHELNSSRKYDVLIDNLRAAGVTVRVVQTNSYDTIATNALLVKQALDMQLSKGKDIILVGLSKGGPESLLALSMLTSKLEGASRPAKYGKVEAYLGLSGVYAGSFLIDWGKKFPQIIIVGNSLRSEYSKEGRELPSLDGVLDIASDKIHSVMAEVRKNRLPQSTTYFSIVGTMPGNGLASQSSPVFQLQSELTRRTLKRYGANDGYIEYPGTAIPNTLVKKSFTVNVSGSHAIIDGTFQSFPMVRSEENVLSAISMSVFELISK